MKHVTWNGKYDLWPQLTKETLQQGTGNNADINMLLIQSLKDVGLEAAPVVLRSRDQGKLPHNFPSFQKLTTFIVGIKQPTQQYAYVDASSAGGWFNALPATLLVDRARLLLKDKKSQWINLQKISKSQTTTIIEATLTADGVLKGELSSHYNGLAAVKHKGDSEVIPFNIQGDVSDGKISVCPFPPTLDLQHSKLEAGHRLMPVEFPCEESQQVTINITLPEGYVLENAPKPIAASTPDKGVNGRYSVMIIEGKVQVQYLFSVSKVSHPESNYEALRGMFDMFDNFTKEKIVVIKK